MTPDQWFGWADAPAWLGPKTQLKHNDDGSTRIRLPSGGELLDTGTAIQTPENPDWKTIEAATLIAASRFGSVNPSGPPEFMFRAWAVAERHGLQVSIPPEMELLHTQYQDYHRERLSSEMWNSLDVNPSPLAERAMERTRIDAEKIERLKQQQAEQKVTAAADTERFRVLLEKLEVLTSKCSSQHAEIDQLKTSVPAVRDYVAQPTARRKFNTRARANP